MNDSLRVICVKLTMPLEPPLLLLGDLCNKAARAQSYFPFRHGGLYGPSMPFAVISRSFWLRMTLS